MHPSITHQATVNLNWSGPVIPNGVSRHTWVSKRGARGATKFGITVFLFIVYYIRGRQVVFFNQLGVPPIFLRPEGCCEPKKVEEHWSGRWLNWLTPEAHWTITKCKHISPRGRFASRLLRNNAINVFFNNEFLMPIFITICRCRRRATLGCVFLCVC